MSLEERQLRVMGVLKNVSVVCDFVVELAREAGLDERAVHHCYLAVDEACTNIIEHGYGLHCDMCIIDVFCRRDDAALTITIVDDSPAFNPLMRPDSDPKTPLSERGVGGWGILFIKKLMDTVSYSHEDNRNRLVMVKKIKKVAVPPSAPAPPKHQPLEAVALSGNIWQVTPRGRLDEEQVDQLAALLSAQLEVGHRWLIIDMADVEFISSAGLKLLVSAWRRARDQKGDLVLAALKPRAREVLEMIGLNLVFELSDTLDQARVYLAAKIK